MPVVSHCALTFLIGVTSVGDCGRIGGRL